MKWTTLKKKIAQRTIFFCQNLMAVEQTINIYHQDHVENCAYDQRKVPHGDLRIEHSKRHSDINIM